MTVAIEIRDLTIDRGKTEVLHGISTTISRGQITGLLGPSGSGKTTLLRAIVGVQIVRSGTVTVLGSPAGAPDLRHRIGYVTQTPSIYLDLTVLENVRYFASLQGTDAAAVGRTLEIAGLGHVQTQLARDLSGGQLSRASLACALVGNPELLVLDEPTVGQDPVLREELWTWFHQLADEGVTLLVSSHVMDEANRCDRLLLVREGSIIADDTPAAVKESAGTDDLDEAFLRLIRRRQGEVA